MMELNEFRATRKLVSMADLIAELPEIADMDYGGEYSQAYLYQGGFYILASRGGLYLHLECEEYETRDVKLLEFLLWEFAFNPKETQEICYKIWG